MRDWYDPSGDDLSTHNAAGASEEAGDRLIMGSVGGYDIRIEKLVNTSSGARVVGVKVKGVSYFATAIAIAHEVWPEAYGCEPYCSPTRNDDGTTTVLFVPPQN